MCMTTSVSILAIEEAESVIKLAMVWGLLILVARDDVSVRTSHYNIFHYPQGQIRGFPGDLSLGISFPGDMSPGISGTEKLEWDTFAGDIVGPT
nr:hypothetical protein [Tanacetum cinerariifolium]